MTDRLIGFRHKQNKSIVEFAKELNMGYDAYYVALEAIKKAGSADPGEILKVLPSVTYEGVCGKVVFKDSGDADRSEAVVKKCNTEEGTWEYLGTQTVQ